MTRNKKKPNMRAIAKALQDEGMRCNCDLDNWEPEPSTGHSWVCRIHNAAMTEAAIVREEKPR